jgi:uncharacterized tellurite resistance protein B-like protein
MNDKTKSQRIDGDELIIDTQSRTESYDSKYLVAALLVFVAKGDGTISGTETQEMMALLDEQYQMPGAEALELLTRAITDIAENPDFSGLMKDLSAVLTIAEKQIIAVMLLKVAAADGRKDAEEMEKLRLAAEMIDIPDDVMHRAFDRYFEETQVLPDEDS